MTEELFGFFTIVGIICVVALMIVLAFVYTHIDVAPDYHTFSVFGFGFIGARLGTLLSRNMALIRGKPIRCSATHAYYIKAPRYINKLLNKNKAAQ